MDRDTGLTVLLVEDEPRMAQFITKGLRQHGFIPVAAATGTAGLVSFATRRPDMVVLDLGLPDIDGRDVLRRIRAAEPACPVLLLTARAEVEDRIEGLELGADDYLVKPFAFAELVARIHAIERRTAQSRTVIGGAGVELDIRTGVVKVGAGRATNLTPQEARVLDAFLRHRGTVLDRSELLRMAWGFELDPGSNLVDSYVRSLRRKLGRDCIETVRGRGYRFVGLERARS
jgi:DNA-binding response OmpR family regulator